MKLGLAELPRCIDEVLTTFCMECSSKIYVAGVQDGDDLLCVECAAKREGPV